MNNSKEEMLPFFLFAFVADIACYLLNGVAVKYLWQWFVVPISGLPVLGIVQAIGIALLAGLLSSHYIPEEDKKLLAKLLARLPHQLAVPLVSLGVGWIVHLFL